MIFRDNSLSDVANLVGAINREIVWFFLDAPKLKELLKAVLGAER